ncbi:hypothetical protein KUTeg_016288 [Tegillarca granosa]|uniref:Uncharacterized protein n=1 Tax=Tegillarca granosa TaxID=220873 RepID=A0ABQ9ER39_TEGGR|nr:hypothetical protein KUTeg_016288 [Tegillarca granosa]
MVSMPIRLRDVRSFPVSYWLIAFMISSYYSCYIPFVGNGRTSHRLRAWKWAFILLTSIAGFCAVCGTILNLSNRKLVKKLNGVVSEKNDCIENEENEKKEKLINDEHQNERKRLLSDATEKGDFYSSFNNSVEL